MDRKTQNRYNARAEIVKALAHPTRLFIVDQLKEGKHCVQELTRLVGSDMSTVSKHLAQLRTAGIVEDEKRGTQVFYSLKMPCVLRMFDCIEPVLQARVRLQLEAIEG